MQLREHPRLYIWPPQLSAAFESESLSSEESEDSILKRVEIKPPYIWISTEYRRKNYLGAIRPFIDPQFFDLLYQKLRDSIGKTIREIGNTELDD
jgi:hypothetical protein